MKYSVEKIASDLFVNKETVRRWIRSGELKATRDSKRGGFMVDEKDLIEFLRSTKYGNRVKLEPIGKEREEEPQKFRIKTSYAVTYYRVKAGVTDMRCFTSIDELSAWFLAQNELETTLITDIRVDT